ncbi:MAG TPA: FkbM family methyltransferase [Gammaproteobacteria bacterium]|nr:FkbM family methyltransferase [Gammaproteobacteria bacterium]
MSFTARAFGIARSLVMYYGIPLRARRLRRFYSQFVTRGSLCIDVGAHAGNRVRCWRQLGAQVVAVEPQPDFVRILRWLYGRDRHVAIVPVALGRAPGHADLLISERTPTVTTLSREWVEGVSRDPRFAGVEWDVSHRVELRTLDELIARFGEPAFVKIDVEGFEAEVLAGLSTPVRALSFEYLPAARDVALACIDRLAELGRYRYNWSPGESHALDEPRWRSAASMRAWLASLPPGSPSGDVYAVRDVGQ